jgi:hypothetical protein|tara:strand:- start:609 stop:842 length:234 start_codon:yes stop_codon:yes gene_type:complete
MTNEINEIPDTDIYHDCMVERKEKPTYKISFDIKTNADPTTLLDLVERQAVEFVDSLEAEYDNYSTLVDGSPCVVVP